MSGTQAERSDNSVTPGGRSDNSQTSGGRNDNSKPPERRRSNSQISERNNDFEHTKPVPSSPHSPQGGTDGGWGWLVVTASFFISLVVDGVGFSLGVFFSSLYREFAASKQQVSWVASVLNGTTLLVGVLANTLSLA